MFPNECVICGKPCSRKDGHHWYLCKECNESYWIPEQDNYTFSSFLNHILSDIECFKADCEEKQNKIWKELGLDDPLTSEKDK